jgi:tRNA threonylcarbamoyl adenosine modification protein YeaZ
MSIQNPKSKIQNRMTKYGLALHTSSPALGLALGSSEDDYRDRSWDLGRDTSNYLHPYLADFIKPQTWQELAWLAVANGPGGFTGTRLGLVTVRTLAQQLEVPIFTISSLAAVVWTLPPACGELSSGKIAISMPAQREEVFAAVYQIDRDRESLSAIVSDTVLSVVEWETELAQFAPCYHHQIDRAANLAETVAGVWKLAQIAYNYGERPDRSLALPFYGQHPVFHPPGARV